MLNTGKRKDARILLYDGGMGTTLEDDFEADISSALWSSTLLKDEVQGHDTLRALHAAFIDAGADLIQTCTYQSSFEGFRRNGYTDESAMTLMRKAVDLAHQSVQSAKTEKGKGRAEDAEEHITSENCRTHTKPFSSLVLALSCYGAILSPGQEYSGRYPPPFGSPMHTQLSTQAEQAASLSSATSNDWKLVAIAALEEWHYNRLNVFASDPTTWNKISIVAFETLPVLYEAIAVRRAMTRLKRDLLQKNQSGKQDLYWPDWWIAFVFPGGSLPSSTSLEEGPLNPEEIARTVFGVYQDDEGQDLEVPNGLGINCTKMRFLPELIDGFTQATASIPRTEKSSTEPRKERWLVVYPDGGLVYDPVTKTWHQDEGQEDGENEAAESRNNENESGQAGAAVAAADPAKIWAIRLLKATEPALKASAGEFAENIVWDRLVLGGCCKASPAYISELSKLVKERLAGSADYPASLAR